MSEVGPKLPQNTRALSNTDAAKVVANPATQTDAAAPVVSSSKEQMATAESLPQPTPPQNIQTQPPVPSSPKPPTEAPPQTPTTSGGQAPPPVDQTKPVVPEEPPFVPPEFPITKTPPLVPGEGSEKEDFEALEKSIKEILEKKEEQLKMEPLLIPTKPPKIPNPVDTLPVPPDMPPPPDTGNPEIDFKRFLEYLESLGKLLKEPFSGLFNPPIVPPVPLESPETDVLDGLLSPPIEVPPPPMPSDGNG